MIPSTVHLLLLWIGRSRYIFIFIRSVAAIRDIEGGGGGSSIATTISSSTCSSIMSSVFSSPQMMMMMMMNADDYGGTLLLLLLLSKRCVVRSLPSPPPDTFPELWSFPAQYNPSASTIHIHHCCTIEILYVVVVVVFCGDAIHSCSYHASSLVLPSRSHFLFSCSRTEGLLLLGGAKFCESTDSSFLLPGLF